MFDTQYGGRSAPRKQRKASCDTLDTRDSPQCPPGRNERTEFCGPSQSCLRHPPPWMGYAGRDSETESALPLKWKTLGHRRLFTSDLLYRFTDAKQGRTSPIILLLGVMEETLQRSQHFCVFVVRKCEAAHPCIATASACFKVSRVTTRSFSAYVPSTRQAGPHAHTL
jgi:hypothetical protein